MWAPSSAPLLVQAAAYTACIAVLQRYLYQNFGTFKHMVQDHEGGCTVAACFGMHPFEHSDVNCSRGALTVALEVRAQLRQIGIRSHCAIKTGRLFHGSVGSDSRREYVAVGEPLQLCSQMLSFASDTQPILVDGTCTSANKRKYNFEGLLASPQRATTAAFHAPGLTRPIPICASTP
jgi:class 3 adenylate cyclase